MQIPTEVITGIGGILLGLLIYWGVLKFKNQGGQEMCRKKCEECPKLLRKNFWYALVLFGVVLVFIAVDLLVGDKDALSWFSFASTITSIVLSVIAIIMTITNEQKSDSIRNAIDNSVSKLEKYTDHMDEQQKTFQDILGKSEEILQKIEDIKHDTSDMRDRIERSFDKTSSEYIDS